GHLACDFTKVLRQYVAGRDLELLCGGGGVHGLESVVDCGTAVIARLDNTPIGKGLLARVKRCRLRRDLVQVRTDGQAYRAHPCVCDANPSLPAKVPLNCETPLRGVRVVEVDLVGRAKGGQARRGNTRR